VPPYVFPESAARALGIMWRYRQHSERLDGRVVEFATDDAKVAEILDATLGAGQLKLCEPDVLRVLQCYGIPVVPWDFVGVRVCPGDTAAATEQPAVSAQPGWDMDAIAELAKGAGDAAERLGLPVALKIVSPQVIHKTDVGGVVLGLDSREEVERAVIAMVTGVSESQASGVAHGAEPIDTIDGVLVQRMAPQGTETIVGLTQMPKMGPMVMFGLGGIYVEALRDVVLRLCPLHDTDAEEMIHEVKLFELLKGVRGQAPRDLTALADVVLRVSQLAVRHPRIAEMDINPLLSLETGVVAVDGRIQLAAPEAATHTASPLSR